jgi:uncharacterized protein (DUF1778 family)
MGTAMLIEEKRRKTNRVDLRISPLEKSLFEQAARAKGLNLTSYIISTVSMDAKATIDREHRVTLTDRTARIFLDALDAEPNDKLIQAAKDFESLNIR